jgi:hypothetical protein
MNEVPPNKFSAVAKLSAMTSAVISRMNFLNRAGLTHEGARDLWTVFGYQTQLAPEDLYLKYRRQDIAKVVVEAPADAIWTRPPTVNADEAFLSKWKEIIKEHNLWSIFNRIDNMLGYSRYAIMLIGINDNQKLDQPARTTSNTKITYIQPFSELSVQIAEYNVDEASPRFGLPLYYNLRINETDVSSNARRTSINAPRVSSRIHYSRVVHIADGIVEDVVFGRPRLEPVYNNLVDLLKTVGGSAETFWLTANRGMQIDIDKDMQLAPEDEEALEDELNEHYHNLRRYIRTRGVKITELGSKVADPSQSVMTIIAMIAATARIPQRLLMGSEAGQLASEQDRANWAERVGERRNKFAEPYAILPTMHRFQALKFLPLTSSLQFEWPEAFILGPLERAQTSAQKARSAANLSRVLSDQKEREDEFISIEEARSIVGFGDETKILETTVIEDSGVSSPR